MSNSEISVGRNDRALNKALNRLARQAQPQQLKEMLTQWTSLLSLFGRLPGGLRRVETAARLPFSALAPDAGDNTLLRPAAHPLRALQGNHASQDHLRAMQETPHIAPEHLHIPAQHVSASLESLPVAAKNLRAPSNNLRAAAQQLPAPRSALYASDGSLPAPVKSLCTPLNNLRSAADSDSASAARRYAPVAQSGVYAGAFQPMACTDHNVNAGARTDILTTLHAVVPYPTTARNTVAASLRLHARDAGLTGHTAHHALPMASVLAATPFAAPALDCPAVKVNPPLKTAALPDAGLSALRYTPDTGPATQSITRNAPAVAPVFPLTPTIATALRAFSAPLPVQHAGQAGNAPAVAPVFPLTPTIATALQAFSVPLPVQHAGQALNIDVIEKRAVAAKNSLTAEHSQSMESGISERNRVGGLSALTGTLNVSALHSVTQSNAFQLNSVVQPGQAIIQNTLLTVMAPKNPLMSADANRLLPARSPTPGISERFKATPVSPSALFATTHPPATALHGHTPDAVRLGGETARFSPQENATASTGASRVHFTPLTAGGKVTHDNRTFTQNIQITVPEGQPLTAQDLQKQFNELMAQQANQAFFTEIQRY